VVKAEARIHLQVREQNIGLSETAGCSGWAPLHGQSRQVQAAASGALVDQWRLRSPGGGGGMRLSLRGGAQGRRIDRVWFKVWTPTGAVAELGGDQQGPWPPLCHGMSG
jgi:hypothetical protein